MLIRHALILPALLAASGVLAADVLVVGPPGSGAPFHELQAAVDAAADGDVLLVRTGAYAGFAVDGLGLSILADADASPRIDGTVELRNLPAGSTCLLDGLVGEAQLEQDALVVTDCAGFVRVQGCRFTGGMGIECGCAGTDGGHAASLRDSPSVAFVGCALTGGHGGGFDVCTCTGGDGGHGLSSEGSAVMLHDCVLSGGHGGEADFYDGNLGGSGGDGARVVTFGLYAAGTRFQGGYGGHGWGGGDGGDGLYVLTGAQARLVEPTLAGGQGGPAGGWSGLGSDGAPGEDIGGGGVFHFLPPLARQLGAPALARDAQGWHMRVRGEPGDRVWLASSSELAHRYQDELAGPWLLEAPTLAAAREVGTIGATGELWITVPAPEVEAPASARLDVFQVLVEGPSGEAVLSGPVHRVTLDCATAGADCDGDGALDTCALLTDPSLDLDGDSLPDSCTGATTTWHVRPAAPPGGDGSAGAPFQTIAQAFEVVSSGDTVLLGDGLYVGPENRSLTVPVARLVVRSANGPAGCIIDPQQMDAVFDALGGFFGPVESLRLEGLRIRHAREAIRTRDVSEVTIEDCILHDNTIASAPALHLDAGRATVRDCVFLRNVTGWDFSPVGNVRLQGGEVLFERCTFQENLAPRGGALTVTAAQTGLVRLRACTFLANRGSVAGGTIWSESSAPLLVENCLVGGSSAPTGGFLYGAADGGQIALSASTFAFCAADSGSLLEIAGNGAAFLEGSIAWDQAPADGAVAHLGGSGARLEVRYSDLQGGEGAVALAPDAILVWGAGNLAADPLFVDPAGPDGDPATAADNDWRLSAASPCLDAGADPLLPQDVSDIDGDGLRGDSLPFDLDGAAREVDQPAVPDAGLGDKPRVDLGAFERP